MDNNDQELPDVIVLAGNQSHLNNTAALPSTNLSSAGGHGESRSRRLVRFNSVDTNNASRIGENQPLLARMDSDVEDDNSFDDPVFESIIKDVEKAIDQEIYPERISQGSSGSYFVRDTKRVSATIQYIQCTNILTRRSIDCLDQQMKYEIIYSYIILSE